MFTIEGKYNTAICFAKEVEESSIEQIKTVCDQKEFEESEIRIMPDVHTGKGCTIGTTMTIVDKIVPGMVGVDIGCGMETVKISEKSIDFEKLDAIIHQSIPAGFNIRKNPHDFTQQIELENLRCIDAVNLIRAKRSIGTLGGGNHFIEVDKNSSGDHYLVVHSGSRHLGCEVAEYYQNQGYKALSGNAKHQIQEKIEQLQKENRKQEIEPSILKLKENNHVSMPKELAYVEGKLFDDYIHDMKIVQKFAELNRKAMIEIIVNKMGFTKSEQFTTIHNYIDTDKMILRKGAVSAKLGEKILVPINMSDGSLICTGKGNKEWNESAPHGAGRIMSRGAAFRQLSLDEYKQKMEGIYSSCIVVKTLDESPMAYKSIEEIMSQIVPTADIVDRIIPVYNFKSTE